MAQRLEEEFKKRERERVESEQLKVLVKQGISVDEGLVEAGILEKLEGLQQHFNSLNLEVPLNDLIALFKQRVHFLDELKEQQHFKLLELMTEANDGFKGITDTLNVIAQSNRDAVAKMDKVFTALTFDLVERGKLRARQIETLEKIDIYLEKWG